MSEETTGEIGGTMAGEEMAGNMLVGMCRVCAKPATQTCPLCGALLCPQHVGISRHSCSAH